MLLFMELAMNFISLISITISQLLLSSPYFNVMHFKSYFFNISKYIPI